MLYFTKTESESGMLHIHYRVPLASSNTIISLYSIEVINWDEIPKLGRCTVITKSFKRLSNNYGTYSDLKSGLREKYLNIRHKILYNQFKVYIKVIK